MASVVFSAECPQASKHSDGSSLIIPVLCLSDDRSIDVGFLAEVRYKAALQNVIPKDGQPSDISALLAPTLFEELSHRRMLDIYRSQEFYLQELKSAVATNAAVMSRQEITDSLASGLRNATRVRRATEREFDRAKRWLIDHIHSLRSQPARTRSAVHFLAACLTSSADPDMRAWNMETAGILQRFSENLIKRKDPDHPQYISAADRLKADVQALHFPLYWSAPPPSTETLNL